MSLRELKVRPLIYSAGALFVGINAAIDASGDFIDWHQLQQQPVETSATVLSNQTLLSSSGKILSYDVAYEFTAPNDSFGEASNAPSSAQASGQASGQTNDQSNGPGQSAAEVQALLQEQFWGNGENVAESEVPGEPLTAQMPSPEPVTAPTGEAFFRGAQLVKAKDYSDLDTSRPIKIMYAQGNPGNSAIVGTDAAPSFAPALIGLAALGLGTWFLWESVKNCFGSPALTPVKVEPSDSASSNSQD